MNRIKIKLVLLTCIIATGVSAQEQSGSLKLGVQDAVNLGLKNRYDLQSRKYNVTLATSEVGESKKEWIPEISGSGNMRYSPQLQATYIPGGFVSDDPALVALGANSLAIFGLDLNQIIYKPGISTDVKIARHKVAIAEEKIKQDENTIREVVMNAYLNVLLKDLQKRIATNEENRYKDYTAVAEGKFRLGTMIESDYLKAKLDYENAKVEAQKTVQNYELALVNMKYQINIPEETQLLLTDTLGSTAVSTLDNAGDANVGNRTEIRQLKLQQETNKLEVTRRKQNAVPSVSLYGNYSKQFTYTNLDYSIGRWWSSFNYIGLRISVPITSNFKNRNSIDEYRIKSTQTDLDLQQKIADVNYEIRKAQTELANSMKNMQTTKSNYELSQQIYENQKQQYDLGSRQYNDLLETNRSLNQAEQNYIKAVFDYLVASVNYQKATGKY